MNHLSDYTYDLPDELIAQYPSDVRGRSRLLVAQQDSIEDRSFPDITEYFKAGDLLVLNNTRVIPARIYAQKETGGKIEIMIERILNDQECLVQIKSSKPPREGSIILINEASVFRMKSRQENFFILESTIPVTITEILEQYGHMPLPPYITRTDTKNDSERYQTIFNKEKGAVAAPTAGLHFTKEILAKLRQKGVIITEITLHVGAGTFQPIRVDDLNQHVMHQEWINVPCETVDLIHQQKNAGGRIIAIGTTVVRALETAALTGNLIPYSGDTRIFIKHGFKFRVIDGLMTNFHLSKSTLLVLVSTFMGKKRIEKIYQHAIEKGYRFYSYGDTMLLLP